MRFEPWLALLTAVTLLAPSVAAQSPDTAPPVEIEDAEIEGLVEPLDEPGETTLTVSVGCETHEGPDTDTLVELQADRAPAWLNVVVSPSSLVWKTGPGDCPSASMPFTANTTISASTTQDAPAYEPTRLQIAATVTKKPPAGTDERTYGPYTANVSLTPGYFHLHNAFAEEKIKQADPGETIRFTLTITSASNHETAFTMTTVGQLDPFSVSYDPDRLVLAPNGSGEVTVAVEPENASQAPRGTVSVETEIQGNSTHELGGEGGTSRQSFLAKFQGEGPDPRDQVPVPGASPAAALASLAAVAFAAASRTRGRP